MLSHPIIANSYILVHRDEFPKGIDLPKIFAETSDEINTEGEIEPKFGVLYIQSKKASQEKKPICIQFTLDISESMSEGRPTKIDCLKETVMKLMNIIAEKDFELLVQVNIFNNQYNTIIDLTKITKENLTENINKIENIYVNGTTNIELAIDKTNEACEKYMKTNPDSKLFHLFLTDGHATCGENRTKKLVEKISDSYTSIFIGYGEEHNSDLLYKFAEKNKDNSYQFINEFEKTTHLCAELFYEIMYPAIKIPELIVNGGKIFDALKNEWVSSIDFSSFVSQKEYEFPLCFVDEETVSVELYGIPCHLFDDSSVHQVEEKILLDTIITLPPLMDATTNEIEKQNLTKDIFKYQTGKILYEVGNKKYRSRTKITNFFKIVHKYARENELLFDLQYLVIMDDLYTCYKTYGTNVSSMYSLARHTSIRRQQCYRSPSPYKSATINNITKQPSSYERTRSYTQEYDYEMEFDSSDFSEEQPEFENIMDEDSIEKYRENHTEICLNETDELRRFTQEVVECSQK